MTQAFFPCLLVLHNKNLCSLPVRPLEVEILFNNQPLSADRQYEVECQAIGSRPPSVITWWMNGLALVAQPTKVNWFLFFLLSFLFNFSSLGGMFSCYVTCEYSKNQSYLYLLRIERLLHCMTAFPYTIRSAPFYALFKHEITWILLIFLLTFSQYIVRSIINS